MGYLLPTVPELSPPDHSPRTEIPTHSCHVFGTGVGDTVPNALPMSFPVLTARMLLPARWTLPCTARSAAACAARYCPTHPLRHVRYWRRA
eukprot:916021-Rhodomonas_salina.2